MHAGKALLLVLILGSVLAAGVFLAVPSMRPPIVKKWFRSAAGFSPAKTPDEALTKFKDCIKKRDYETAAEVYCTGDYREQMLKVAAKAKELGLMIDSLVDNMDTKGVVNPNTKATLKLLEPFPKSFTWKNIQQSEGGDTAVATLGPDEDNTLAKMDKSLPATFFTDHGKMINALVPVVGVTGLTQIKLVKDSSGFWKLDFPVTPELRVRVEYLRDNGTNYKNAIQQVRDEVKNTASTKENVQSELLERLRQSK